jgi:shikimate dehydrogenase
MNDPIRLGLIGDNIGRSRSPALHRLAGRLAGLDVTYESLIPADLSLEFDDVFALCERRGFRGLNITYPYKERVMERLRVDDPAVAAIGACNTVVFDGAARPQGFNTDCSGFAHAFRERFGAVSPGRVAMAGAGGVGKAIGFALARLGADELRIFDRDAHKVEQLVNALVQAGHHGVRGVDSIEEAMDQADGLINSTPLGMVGYGGSAFPAGLVSSAHWAFDAVYTPVETPFLLDARRAGLDLISGYELFFYQGLDAFGIFTGATIDADVLRRALRDED